MATACEWLLAAIYVASVAIIGFAVTVRSRANVTDVERHCLRRGVAMWYLYRAAAALVVAGGLMHARVAVVTAAGHLWSRVFG